MSTIKLAVYGTLKKGEHNDNFLKNSKFLGEFVTSPNFTMYNLGGFPAVVPEGNTSIHCEIYELNPLDKNGVYRLEGYTGIKNDERNFYDCIEIETHFGKAEMFIFNFKPTNYLSILKTGIWKR